jgi:hypothetical protein
MCTNNLPGDKGAAGFGWKPPGGYMFKVAIAIGGRLTSRGDGAN